MYLCIGVITLDKQIEVFKALSDKNRLLILEMLSCGEMCACDIMDKLKLTQPTISHHMKVLHHAGLINTKKSGKWMIYSINKELVDEITKFIVKLTSYKDDCICMGLNRSCGIDEN